MNYQIVDNKDYFYDETKSIWVYLSESEALGLIASLAHQIRDQDPNSKRIEFLTSNGDYFTIAVL